MHRRDSVPAKLLPISIDVLTGGLDVISGKCIVFFLYFEIGTSVSDNSDIEKSALNSII